MKPPAMRSTVPGRRLLAHLHVRDDLVARQHALDQQFDLAAGGLLAEQARLHDLRVVEHQQVAGAQQRRAGRGRRGRPARRRCRRAGASRCARAAGCWAISSGGRAKSKSPRVKCAHALEGWTGPCQAEEGRIVPCPTQALPSPEPPSRPRLRRRLSGARRKPCTSWAWRATSTWRCTCRCATRTKRASCRLRDAREGDTAQIEATVTDCEVAVPPAPPAGGDGGRRQRHLRAALLHFYPSQQKALAGARACACAANCKGGFLGWQMVHPTVKPAGGELPDGADAGLSHRAPACRRPTCARRCVGGLARADLSRDLPAGRQPAPGRLRLEPARGAALPAPPAAGRARWPRWRTAAIRPGSG